MTRKSYIIPCLNEIRMDLQDGFLNVVSSITGNADLKLGNTSDVSDAENRVKAARELFWDEE